jgi:hypothetical protein
MSILICNISPRYMKSYLCPFFLSFRSSFHNSFSFFISLTFLFLFWNNFLSMWIKVGKTCLLFLPSGISFHRQNSITTHNEGSAVQKNKSKQKELLAILGWTQEHFHLHRLSTHVITDPDVVPKVVLPIFSTCTLYDGIFKSFRTGCLERELQVVQISATRCSCIAILWVSLVSVASQGAFIALVIYFVFYSVRKLLDTASMHIYAHKRARAHTHTHTHKVQVIIHKPIWMTS